MRNTSFLIRCLILVLCLFFWAGTLPCQATESPCVDWIRSFGGPAWDWSYSIQPKSDVGYTLVGCTESYGKGDSDTYLLEVSQNGQKLMEKAFGGKYDDGGISLQIQNNGSYLIAGGSNANFSHQGVKAYINGGDTSMLYLNSKMDLIGTFLYPGVGGNWSNSIQLSGDDNYVMAGWKYSDRTMNSYSDIYILKTDLSGNRLWEKTFGGNKNDFAYSLDRAIDGGFIIGGQTHSEISKSVDAYLIKIDNTGNKEWEKRLGGSGYDRIDSVHQVRGGGFIGAGYTDSLGAGSLDAYLIKTDALGNLQWEKTFGGSADDWANCVQETVDGGYIIVGCTKSAGSGGIDIYAVKTDSQGNEQWEKTLGGTYDDNGESICQTSDGAYVICGSIASRYDPGDIFITKLESDNSIPTKETTQILVNGKPLNTNPAPRIIENRLMVPLQDLADALKSKMIWDASAQVFTLICNGNCLQMKLSSYSCLANKQMVHIDIPAQIINKNIYLPLRYACEALGIIVFWDTSANTAFIISK